MGRDEIGTDSPADFDEAVAKGYVAKTPTGQPYLFVSNFQNLAALIDFTNPEAVTWWQGRIREALELGATGFMQDFGEQTQSDMVFHDGSTGAQMHNRYPVLFHRATRAFLDAEGRSDDVVFYTRAGYSGLPGSAADESSNFPGDETTDWSRSSGLASLTTDMLNRGTGGLFGYMTDIGGYFDIGPYSPTTKELFLRWAEWAALSPQFRLHGSVGAGTHTPWSFDEETVQVYNALSRLHLAARPLILRLWREAVETGVPVARPLWMAFPGDAEAARQDQQWMLGDDVLVAPVVVEGALSRDVYFPAGCWEHPETGARFTGPRSAKVDAPLDQLPYFFRCGSRPFAPFAAAGSDVALPRARTCRSRRRFTIRLVRPRRGRIVAARVYVNGKRVRTVRSRGRVLARVDLRGLPRGRFTVRIVVRTRPRPDVRRQAPLPDVRRRARLAAALAVRLVVFELDDVWLERGGVEVLRGVSATLGRGADGAARAVGVGEVVAAAAAQPARRRLARARAVPRRRRPDARPGRAAAPGRARAAAPRAAGRHGGGGRRVRRGAVRARGRRRRAARAGRARPGVRGAARRRGCRSASSSG